MNIKKTFLFIFLLYLAIFFTHVLIVKKTVYGDGIFYYSWVRSAVVDGDFNFANEYAHFGVYQPKTMTNRVRNIYSIGPAILWLPAFMLTHSLVRGSGYELSYQIAVGAAGVIYAIIGLILVYRLLIKIFSQEVVIPTILGISLATNLLFYGSVDTVNSHGFTFFAGSLFLTFIMENPKKNWMATGASLGLIGLIRMQDLIYGLFILPSLKIHYFLIFLFGFILMLSPQFYLWNIFQGSMFTSPYFAEKVFYFRPLQPNIIEVLISPLNGLLFWTPILIFAALGFLTPNFRLKRINILAVVILFLQLYITSIREAWSQEASFSGRMFVGVLPLFSFGLAQFITYIKKIKFLANFVFPGVCLLSSFNALLVIYYLLYH